ncbi:MAG: hypothetical protein AAAFM81_03440 [Pseudomonadota bacterium]
MSPTVPKKRFVIVASLLLSAMVGLNVGHCSDDGVMSYGNSVAKLNTALARKLAEANQPNAVGAMGRNRRQYIHVRFQLGLHHLADYGLIAQRVDVLEQFLTAAEYAMAYQLPTGNFRLDVPKSMAGRGSPSIADRASGTSFFIASLGLGLLALETNDWFQKAEDCVDLRRRAAQIRSRLRSTRQYLEKSEPVLMAADKHAPNRLLFNAIAIYTLNALLSDGASVQVADRYLALALGQVNQEAGYFIEGGGYDSSYNAVAAALALRLVLTAYPSAELQPIAASAIEWQRSRIDERGEVSTVGNARVRPGQGGESFMGREKDVDVKHVVDAFMTASLVFEDPELIEVAQRIVTHYERR